MGIPPYRSQPDKSRLDHLNMKLEIPPFQEKGPISNSVMQAPKETRGIHPQSLFSNPEIQKSKISQISPANHQLEEEPEELSTKESNKLKKEGRIFVGNNKVNKFIDKFGCNKITYEPAVGYTPKKSAIMDLSRIIKSTIKKGGINTSEELHYFQIQFETMVHFFVSHQYITHIDQFTKLLWKEYPEEASKKFQVKQEGITSDQQEFILDNPEDHSPVGATAENYPSEHMSLPPCTLGMIEEKKNSVNLDHEEDYFGPEILILEGVLIAEKSPAVSEEDPEGLLIELKSTWNFIEEEEPDNYVNVEMEINHEPALDPVEVVQHPEIKSIETSAPTERSEPPEETRAAGDHAYLDECHSQSDWNFQYEILSEKSSTNISETIKTLDFEEESLLHKEKLENYLAAVLKPSQPASSDNVEKAISQTIEEKTYFLKEPIKSNSPHILEKICKRISQIASFNSPDTTGMNSHAFETAEINWNHLKIPWGLFAAGIVLLASLFLNCLSWIGIDCLRRRKILGERGGKASKMHWKTWSTAWTEWRGGTISADLLRKVTRPGFQMDSIQWFDGRRWCRTMRNVIDIAKKKKDCLETLNIRSGRRKDGTHSFMARGSSLDIQQHKKNIGRCRNQLLSDATRAVVHITHKSTRNSSAYLNKQPWPSSIVRQMLSNSKLLIFASFFILGFYFFLPAQSVAYERTRLNISSLFSSSYSDRARRLAPGESSLLLLIIFRLVELFAINDGYQIATALLLPSDIFKNQESGPTHIKRKQSTMHTNLGLERQDQVRRFLGITTVFFTAKAIIHTSMKTTKEMMVLLSPRVISKAAGPIPSQMKMTIHQEND
ncbi:hypothetical protein KEM48_000023 [Puccinia striiformis f. sp. tritici PST-130]|nr:hypothetical protein KEM48_000023 [Puccinia striiformis f. sp. tritici PST-130]